MSDVVDTRVMDILRRIELVLAQLQQDVTAIRRTVQEMQVTLASKPGRVELWGAMALMVALFAMALGGLAVVLPLVAKHIG